MERNLRPVSKPDMPDVTEYKKSPALKRKIWIVLIVFAFFIFLLTFSPLLIRKPG